MTSAVALPQLELHNDSSSPAMARKRRREILLSLRAGGLPEVISSTTILPEETPSSKRLKVAEVSSEGESDTSVGPVATKKKKAKKPQMKYDPDVPMTKEEAAVWRREQRRKRNRESAAASRQRQRDRIAELEVELDEWKAKFGDIMDQLRTMEQVTQTPVTADLLEDIAHLTPCSFVDDTGKVKEEEGQVHHVEEEEEEQLYNKMNLRPAQSRVTP